MMIYFSYFILFIYWPILLLLFLHHIFFFKSGILLFITAHHHHYNTILTKLELAELRPQSVFVRQLNCTIIIWHHY